MSHPPDENPPAHFDPLGVDDVAAVVTNGKGPKAPELDPPRRFGFAIGVLRNFRGPHSRTARGAVSSAAGRGALAGHTAATQPRGVGHEALQARSVVRQRAARLAQRAYERAQGPASAYGDAAETIRSLEPQRSEVRAHTTQLRRVLDRLERQLIALERKLPVPKVAPPPSNAEQAEWAEDQIPGYRLPVASKRLLFACAASIEGIFAGSMISELAKIGRFGLPAMVNTALPWTVGSVIGAAIPFAAERAAHAEASAPDGAPWYQRWVTTAMIAAPASLGTARALFLWDRDGRYAGMLALAIGLLMTALAMVGAAIGRREREGELWDAARSGRDAIRERVRRSQIPPPSPQERELMATVALRDRVAEESRRLYGRYEALGARIADARGDMGRARGSLLVAGEQSALDAQEQAGLGDSMQVTFAQRRAAQLALYVRGSAGAYEEQAIEPIEPGSLAQLNAAGLMQRVQSDHQEEDHA